MTRIIAGAARGRRLQVPAGQQTRPTGDRVREALFSRLEHDGWLSETRVLDLFAGSGALGLEAASRGAREVVLVEHAPAALAAARRNVAGCELPQVRVVADRVERYLATGAVEPFDLVLADPPYPLAEMAVGELLARLVDGRWLTAPALVVLERAARSPEPVWPAGLGLVDGRRYGETRLWIAEPG